jgi:uncharacterized membrane protein
MENEQNTTVSPQEDHSFGPIVGIIIIVMILIFGGLYFYGASIKEAAIMPQGAAQKNSSFEVLSTTITDDNVTEEEFEDLFSDDDSFTIE